MNEMMRYNALSTNICVILKLCFVFIQTVPSATINTEQTNLTLTTNLIHSPSFQPHFWKFLCPKKKRMIIVHLNRFNYSLQKPIDKNVDATLIKYFLNIITLVILFPPFFHKQF